MEWNGIEWNRIGVGWGFFSFLNLSPGRGEVSKMSADSLAYCGTYVYTSHNLNDPFEQIFRFP